MFTFFGGMVTVGWSFDEYLFGDIQWTACGDGLTGAFFPPGILAVIIVHPLPCKAFEREVRYGLPAPSVAYASPLFLFWRTILCLVSRRVASETFGPDATLLSLPRFSLYIVKHDNDMRCVAVP